MALHSNDDSLPDARKFFGVAEYVFDEHRAPVAIKHYSHHGLLTPTLFRPYAKLLGHRDVAPRSFALLASLASTCLMFALLGPGLGLASRFALTLLYVLTPLKLAYANQFLHEHLCELAILASFLTLRLCEEGRRGARVAFLACFFLLFHSDYPAFLAACLLWLHLVRVERRGSPALRGLSRAAAATALCGIATTFALQYALGFDWQRIQEMFLVRASSGLEEVSPADWLERQRLYVAQHFGVAQLLLTGTALLHALGSRRPLANSQLVFGWIPIAANLAWMALFRNHVYFHAFLQWYLVPGGVLLAAGSLRRLRPGLAGRGRAVRAGLALAALLVLAETTHAARALHQRLAHSARGKPEDIAAIRGLDRRLVVFSDDLSGPFDWWQSIVIQLYTDPIARGWAHPGAVWVGDAGAFDPERDLLVALNDPTQIARVVRYCRRYHGVGRAKPLIQTPNFAFLEFTLRKPGAQRAHRR
jgi:hypothetical protein